MPKTFRASTKSILQLAKDTFKNRVFFFWLGVRTLAAFGPLITTYLISALVKYLGAGKGIEEIFNLLLLLLLVEATEHLLRLSSKTRLIILTESLLIDIHKKLIDKLDGEVLHRRELMQSVRNFTRSIRSFVQFLSDLGVAGFVSFSVIPVILFFIDFRVFLIEVVLLAIYLLLNYSVFNKYEKHFEGFDKSREYYFSALTSTNDIDEEANYVRKFVRTVENTSFANWMFLRNFVSIVNFVILCLVINDVLVGTKDLGDLVLIVGYIRETSLFLSSVTMTVQRYMEVKAGAQRVHAMFLKVKRSTADLV